MEIISFSLEPHPVRHPLVLVVVCAVSLLHKMLVLRLNWDQLRDERPGAVRKHKGNIIPTELMHKYTAKQYVVSFSNKASL